MRNFRCILIVLMIIPVYLMAQEDSTYTDPRDGKTYKIIKIGEQIWFAENLAFKIDSGCYAYSNNVTNFETYGYLYSWYAANSVCPPGWRLPTDADWTTLFNYIGGVGIAGNLLKESGTKHWDFPNTSASNKYGFTALPGGYRDTNGLFKLIGSRGYWWSATEPNAFSASYLYMTFNGSFAYRDYCNKAKCYSIRCIKN